MVKKILITVVILSNLLLAENDIYIFSKNNINKIDITLTREEGNYYRENIKSNITYWGFNPWREEKILPNKYTDEQNLINLNKILKPSNISVDSITMSLPLEMTPQYGNDFFRINIAEDEKIKCTIHGNNQTYNGFVLVDSKDPKKFSISGTLKVISVNMILGILEEYISPKGEIWNISGNKVVSDFFEPISATNLPAQDFVTIRINSLNSKKSNSNQPYYNIDPYNPQHFSGSKVKFQAMNKSMDRMHDIQFIQKDDNTFQIPNVKFHRLTCWYENKKQTITEQYTISDHLDRRMTFNFVFNGKNGKFVKPAGKTNVYLPFPTRNIESISCTFGNQTKAVTLKDNHTISVNEPIAVVLDLNSTRTTNKKNKYDYLDFIKGLYTASENSSVRLFKLLYVFPRAASFEKFDIEKIYTKYKNSAYNTVKKEDATEFVKWRKEREKSSIDPSNIPQDYFCMELINNASLFDNGISSTLVKENMADRNYVQNFQYVLERLKKESGYSFKKVYYVSYFPVLPMYKIEGVNYISFLKDHDKFNLTNIAN